MKTAERQEILSLLKCYTWQEVKQQVKSIYQSVKNMLTEYAQEELLLNIYLNTLADTDYSGYWQYMNR